MVNKIVPNISKFNFEYRVVRHVHKNKDGTATIIDGELQTYLDIYEIWFGSKGEIVAYCGERESPIAEDLDWLKGEIKEYQKALKKPILNFEFVKDQTRRSMRRIKKQIKMNDAPDSEIGLATQNKDKFEKGEANCIPLEDVMATLGINLLDYEKIPYREAIKKFGMDRYDE